MSRPTGNSRNPIDAFSDVSHETWEQAGRDRQNSGNDDHPLRSPYAPPPKAHTSPSVEPEFVESEDAAPSAPLRVSQGLREHSAQRRHAVEADHSRRYVDGAAGRARAPAMPMSQVRDDHSPLTAFEVTAAPRDLVEPDAARPAPSNSWRHERTAATRRDEIMSDLERLEADLRRVRREQTTARLPRATQLPPVPGPTPLGEMFDDGYRSPRSLEPDPLVPPAMMSRRPRLFWPLGIMMASILAAPIAYHVLVGGRASPSPHGLRIASVDPMPVVRPSISKKEGQLIGAQDDDPKSLVEAEIASQPTKTSRIAKLSEGETVAMFPPSETGIQASPSHKTIRALGPEEIQLLTKQGKHLAGAGDFVTARVLFLRAAEVGDATAATALAATYDPAVIAKLGVVGIGADVDKARFWYQKAASLGSSDAKRRLELLANR